ncbi:50S ribosomal protein L20 [candidate division TA06 bacterium SM1_40]|jgi:large subunit ribosomal protein L20|uniref:Large ribosomal subunit protein bL20 n=2 Tax=Bacteria division TA06 TaxID=1156500 RepID=A0A0S8JGG5_UNCT6|nr:MAG: 50S ribosomal protein L20 [candidate division TA06 bacterium SM23_40]KPL07885.1 MAG: 50S ribosomal protein L20 [candidate division TA06 bacterium SM1_40]
MPRVRSQVASHRRKRRTLRQAKGYWGGKHRLYRTAKESVMRAGQYAYRDRRRRKRDFRRLWIIRVNAAARLRGLTYASLINGLKRAEVTMDRKMLADLAVRDPQAFDQLAEIAKGALDREQHA